MLPHDAPEEIFKAWYRGLLDGLIGSFPLGGSGLVSNGGSPGMAQAAVVVVFRVAVGVRQDYAILSRLWRCNDGRRKLAAAGVEWVAVGLGWGLDVSFGLGARLHRCAVFVIVHIAVVALLGLAGDPEVVADLVD